MGEVVDAAAAANTFGEAVGAGGGGRRALAHPRPKSVGSSRLCHLRIHKSAAREKELKFSETGRKSCKTKMIWNQVYKGD